jgi:hypothetical protein
VIGVTCLGSCLTPTVLPDHSGYRAIISDKDDIPKRIIQLSNAKEFMKLPERNIDYQVGIINDYISIHVGRGYLKENGKYKQTLSVPVDPSCVSDVLYEQLLQFESIYAIDSNTSTRGFSGRALVASCAVHIGLEYEGNNRWKYALFTRLPAVISEGTEGNPEVFAWKRIIQYFSPKIQGMMALIVDSELGDIPLFNARAKPICHDFFLPQNTQLIYASAERDLISPLNKAIQCCDEDAKMMLNVIIRNCDVEKIFSDLSSSPNGCIYIPPLYA